MKSVPRVQRPRIQMSPRFHWVLLNSFLVKYPVVREYHVGEIPPVARSLDVENDPPSTQLFSNFNVSDDKHSLLEKRESIDPRMFWNHKQTATAHRFS